MTDWQNKVRQPGEAGAIETQRAEKKPEAVQQELLPKQEANTLGDELSGYSMVGVAFDTYIILQNQKQLIMIDQHAAHERILYEKLMREIDAGVGSQLLMVAQVVHVTPQDAVKIEAYREDIQAAGFDIELLATMLIRFALCQTCWACRRQRALFWIWWIVWGNSACFQLHRSGAMRFCKWRAKKRLKAEIS